MFERLKSVFAVGDGSQRRKPRVEKRGRRVSREELLNALSDLQVEESGAATFGSLEERANESFRERLAGKLGCSSIDLCLEGHELDRILFAELLFRFIHRDQNIPLQLRPMLESMQPSYAKLGILDPAFFKDEQHPGWRLLDTVACAVIGWSPEFENAESSVQRRIEVIVGRVLLDFEENIDLFVEVEKEFSGFAKHDAAEAKANEERTVRASRGREALEAVRQRTVEEIDVRLENTRALPKVVEVILRDGWRNVLLKTGLHDGLDSARWKEAIRTIELLIWSVSADTSKRHRRALVQEIPNIVSRLKAGLEEIAYSPEKRKRLMKKLRDVHLACIRGQDVWMSTEGDTTTVLLGGASRDEPLDGEAQESPDMTMTDNFFWIGKSLPEGSWLELREARTTKQRIKLAWKSQIADLCLFVDRRGDQVMELGYGELANMLRQGKALVLSDVEIPFRKRAVAYIEKHWWEEQAAKTQVG
jgi:hypothetical protein